MSKDFAFSQPVVSGSQHYRPGRSFVRMLIWLGVMGWCLIPFVWLGGMFATSLMDQASKPTVAKDKKKAPVSFEVDDEPRVRPAAPVSPVYAMLSSSLMLMAFSYSV